MHLGKRIEELIKNKGLSVIEISEAIGKTRQTVYDLFEKPHVNTDILEKLSKKLDIPLSYFFAESLIDITPHQTTDKSIATNIDMQEWLADRKKIIHLQGKELQFEKSRIAFAAFLENLREDIIQKKQYKKRLKQNQEKELLKDSTFDEVHEILAENNQKAYEEVFRLYHDFEIFFETGIIKNPYWIEAWERYQRKKLP